MQKPEKPWPPFEWDYKKEYENKTILLKQYVNLYLDNNLNDFIEDWKEENDWKEEDPLPDFKELYNNNEVCTLADILERVPDGVLPENVIINMNCDDRHSEIDIKIIVKLPTNKEMLESAYQQALKDFEEKDKQYQKDLAVFQKWEKEQEIKKLEEKIIDLKKHL